MGSGIVELMLAKRYHLPFGCKFLLATVPTTETFRSCNFFYKTFNDKHLIVLKHIFLTKHYKQHRPIKIAVHASHQDKNDTRY